MENIIDTICAKADEASIRQAGQILKRGGLVAFPTETVYGLGADALNEDAAAKIYISQSEKCWMALFRRCHPRRNS